MNDQDEPGMLDGHKAQITGEEYDALSEEEQKMDVSEDQYAVFKARKDFVDSHFGPQLSRRALRTYISLTGAGVALFLGTLINGAITELRYAACEARKHSALHASSGIVMFYDRAQELCEEAGALQRARSRPLIFRDPVDDATYTRHMNEISQMYAAVKDGITYSLANDPAAKGVPAPPPCRSLDSLLAAHRTATTSSRR
jgi:hypothetical protein